MSIVQFGQVIQYRTYEKPPKNVKNSEEKQHKFYMEKKRQYALPFQFGDKASQGLQTMWDFVKIKAGEQK